MNFYWNAFSLKNIFLDIAICLGYIIIFWFYFRKKNIKFFAFKFSSMDYTISFFKSILYTLLIGSILGILFGFSTFFRVRLLWTSLTFILPIFLFTYSIKQRKYFLFLGIFILLGLKYYAERIEPYSLDVERIIIKSDRIKTPIRITHLSDLQTDGINDMHINARKVSDEFDPHLIIFTGDVLNHRSISEEVEEYLKKFKSLHSSYFVSGNVDNILDFEQFSKKIEFIFFDNRSKVLSVNENSIGVLGLGLNEYKNKQLIHKLIGEIESADFKILMSHYPDTILNLPDSKPDLILAGHTHGGQVCFPLFGPILTLSNVPRRIAAGGLHFFNGVNIIVSRGLGMEGHIAPRIRMLNKPHLVLIELLPK